MILKEGIIKTSKDADFNCQYSAVTIADVKKSFEYIETLKIDNKISQNKVFQSYLDFKYDDIAKEMPDAKTMIVFAIELLPLQLNYQYKDRSESITIPHQYYSTGLEQEDIEKFTKLNIVSSSEVKYKYWGRVFLKHLAVRSGVAKYGKNNICYNESMGSYILLAGVLLNEDLPYTQWNNLSFTDNCEDCSICVSSCPTGSISSENSIIDQGRCISLYNEVSADFPEEIKLQKHSAMMGCILCQDDCPNNAGLKSKNIQIQNSREAGHFLDGDFYSGKISQLLELFDADPKTDLDYLNTLKRNWKYYRDTIYSRK